MKHHIRIHSHEQVQSPDASELVLPDPIVSGDGDQTAAAAPAIMVDTVEALEAMIHHIQGDRGSGSDEDDDGGGTGGSPGRRGGSTEIAIDLEHHSFRLAVVLQ